MSLKGKNDMQNKATIPGGIGTSKSDQSEKKIEIKSGYEIRLKNHLDNQWADWFDGWTITNIGNDEVLLICSATDHAGLHGVLDKIRDLNLTIISVKMILPDIRTSRSNPNTENP